MWGRGSIRRGNVGGRKIVVKGKICILVQ